MLAGLVGDPITKKYKTLSKSINKESLIKLIKKFIYLKIVKNLFSYPHVLIMAFQNQNISQKQIN